MSISRALLVFSLLAAPLSSFAAPKTVKKTISNGNCAIEFKPMSKPKAPWAAYKAKLPKGTKTIGIELKNGLYQFKVPKPKNLFFRGPSKCLFGPASAVAKKAAAPTPTPPDEMPLDVPAEEVETESSPLVETTTTGPVADATPPPTTADYGDAGVSAPPARSFFSLQALMWPETMTLTVTTAANEAELPNEPLNGTQYALGVGYGYESSGLSWTWGFDAHVLAGLSKLANSAPEAEIQTTFASTGLVGGLLARPYMAYYFGQRSSRFGLAVTLPLIARYGLYKPITEPTASVASPFKFLAGAGTSLRYVSGNSAYALNVNFVNFSKLSFGLQIDF
jgi:hypothetical protein